MGALFANHAQESHPETDGLHPFSRVTSPLRGKGKALFRNVHDLFFQNQSYGENDSLSTHGLRSLDNESESDEDVYPVLKLDNLGTSEERLVDYNGRSSPLTARFSRNDISREMLGNESISSQEDLEDMDNDNIATQDYNQVFQSVLLESSIATIEPDLNEVVFPKISVQTLHDMIAYETYRPHYSSLLIIDCRFEYEFRGGHICGAINAPDHYDIEDKLLRQKYSVAHNVCANLPVLLVFHCEFSNHRGPSLASHLRNHDRMMHHEQYPALRFPDILILEGGYQAFYNAFPNLCWPRAYVQMDSQENLLAKERSLSKFRKDSKRLVTRSTTSLRNKE